jgi:hypothetical protein
MVSSESVIGGEGKRLRIVRDHLGWEIREEHDTGEVRTMRYTDWHRVERARDLFAREVAATLMDQPSTNL